MGLRVDISPSQLLGKQVTCRARASLNAFEHRSSRDHPLLMEISNKFQDALEHFKHLPVISSILNELQAKLPPELYYHSAAHTEEVLGEVLLFATDDELCYRDLHLLALAAAFHDAGFMISSKNNETIGADIARKVLQNSTAVSSGELELIVQMIVDTTLKMTDRGLKQIATTPLSRYLLDADVSNFGRLDFFEKAELVRREIGVSDQASFLGNTFSLLDAHEWYSKGAEARRSAQKKINREELIRRIALTELVK